MTTSDADNGNSEVKEVHTPPVDVGATDAGLVVIGFDTRSVRRSGLILMGLVAALMLALWLFSVSRHFFFLILLAWLFAISLEPGIRWFIRHGRSRGTASAIMGGATLLVALLLGVVFGKFFYSEAAGTSASAQALYHRDDPLTQIALNKGGALSWGGLIKHQGTWLFAQGWDAPEGTRELYFYRSQ